MDYLSAKVRGVGSSAVMTDLDGDRAAFTVAIGKYYASIGATLECLQTVMVCVAVFAIVLVCTYIKANLIVSPWWMCMALAFVWMTFIGNEHIWRPFFYRGLRRTWHQTMTAKSEEIKTERAKNVQGVTIDVDYLASMERAQLLTYVSFFVLIVSSACHVPTFFEAWQADSAMKIAYDATNTYTFAVVLLALFTQCTYTVQQSGFPFGVLLMFLARFLYVWTEHTKSESTSGDLSLVLTLLGWLPLYIFACSVVFAQCKCSDLKERAQKVIYVDTGNVPKKESSRNQVRVHAASSETLIMNNARYEAKDLSSLLLCLWMTGVDALFWPQYFEVEAGSKIFYWILFPFIVAQISAVFMWDTTLLYDMMQGFHGLSRIAFMQYFLEFVVSNFVESVSMGVTFEVKYNGTDGELDAIKLKKWHHENDARLQEEQRVVWVTDIHKHLFDFKTQDGLKLQTVCLLVMSVVAFFKFCKFFTKSCCSSTGRGPRWTLVSWLNKSVLNGIFEVQWHNNCALMYAMGVCRVAQFMYIDIIVSRLFMLYLFCLMLLHVSCRNTVRNELGLPEGPLQAAKQTLVERPRIDYQSDWFPKIMIPIGACFMEGIKQLFGGILMFFVWNVMSGQLDTKDILVLGLCIPFFVLTYLMETFHQFMLPYLAQNAVRVDDGASWHTTRRIPVDVWQHLYYRFAYHEASASGTVAGASGNSQGPAPVGDNTYWFLAQKLQKMCWPQFLWTKRTERVDVGLINGTAEEMLNVVKCCSDILEKSEYRGADQLFAAKQMNPIEQLAMWAVVIGMMGYPTGKSAQTTHKEYLERKIARSAHHTEMERHLLAMVWAPCSMFKPDNASDWKSLPLKASSMDVSDFQNLVNTCMPRLIHALHDVDASGRLVNHDLAKRVAALFHMQDYVVGEAPVLLHAEFFDNLIGILRDYDPTAPAVSPAPAV